MKVEFKRSFAKDLERVRDKNLRERVRHTIEQIEEAQTLEDIGNVRRRRGGEEYYRIRVGDYRLGLMLQGDTVIFPVLAQEGRLSVLSLTRPSRNQSQLLPAESPPSIPPARGGEAPTGQGGQD